MYPVPQGGTENAFYSLAQDYRGVRSLTSYPGPGTKFKHRAQAWTRDSSNLIMGRPEKHNYIIITDSNSIVGHPD